MQFVARLVCAALIVVEKWRQRVSRPGWVLGKARRPASMFGSISWRWLQGYPAHYAAVMRWPLSSLAPASAGSLPAGAPGAVRARGVVEHPPPSTSRRCPAGRRLRPGPGAWDPVRAAMVARSPHHAGRAPWRFRAWQTLALGRRL